MTTPYKAEKKRPEKKESLDWPFYGFYYASEADALFESLETDLGDTKRALELMCVDYRQEEMACGVNKNLSTVEEYMGYARKERASLPDLPTVAEDKP